MSYNNFHALSLTMHFQFQFVLYTCTCMYSSTEKKTYREVASIPGRTEVEA